MTDIIKASETGLVTVTSNNILLQPSIVQVDKHEVFDAVKKAIAVSFADLNKEVPNREDLSYMINRVTDILIKKYKSIRLCEIAIAFENGIRGEYGEYYGNLSVINLERFISARLNSNERLELINAREKLLLEVRTEPTRDDRYKDGVKIVLDVFEKYKTLGIIDLFAVSAFEFVKLIELGRASKKNIFKEAIEKTIEDSLREIALCTNIFKKRELNTKLELLRDNIEKDMITIDQHDEIMRTAKRIALRRWFDDIIKERIDLQVLLASKREFYVNLKESKE